MITSQQKRALDFIVDYQSRMGGVSPSVREIAVGIGLSPKSMGGAFRLLESLVERGRVRRIPLHARAIEVIDSRPQPKPLIAFERARYFKFDDEEKRFVEWKKP